MPDFSAVALAHKRVESDGEIEARHTSLHKIRADWICTHVTIRIMGSDTDAERLRPKRSSRKGCG